ncbi:uncharacterized protein LOC128957938 [Oppia nitens]|uniref:uncharacterized protein LOC128957938 n=1 Tax=Oppia nitens TaxID=1686743 RepID=UPI0023DA6538|nr:uncharacterized protein LOC128957938 [Oppia nitens]
MLLKVIVSCFVVTLVNAGDYQNSGTLSSNDYGGNSFDLSTSAGYISGYNSGYSSGDSSSLNSISAGLSNAAVVSAPVSSVSTLSGGDGIVSAALPTSTTTLGSGSTANFGAGLALAVPQFFTGFSGLSGFPGSPGRTTAAIQSRRTFEIRPIPVSQEPAVPQVIEVEPSEQPVQVIFRSVSSPVLVQQIHTPGTPGRVESTRSEDEPHRVLHEVLRPVIQEVREVIQPYRRVTQEVRPVLEEVHTVVAKGEKANGYGSAFGDNGSYGARSSSLHTSRAKLAKALSASGYYGRAAKGAKAAAKRARA